MVSRRRQRWFPRVHLSDTMICFDDGEAEGPLLMIEWGPFVIEIAFARFARKVG